MAETMSDINEQLARVSQDIHTIPEHSDFAKDGYEIVIAGEPGEQSEYYVTEKTDPNEEGIYQRVTYRWGSQREPAVITIDRPEADRHSFRLPEAYELGYRLFEASDMPRLKNIIDQYKEEPEEE